MICDPLFRSNGFRRTDLSLQPLGFWFMWRPRPADAPPAPRFAPIPFAWKVGFYWYPPSLWSWDMSWRDRLPRITFERTP